MRAFQTRIGSETGPPNFQCRSTEQRAFYAEGCSVPVSLQHAAELSLPTQSGAAAAGAAQIDRSAMDAQQTLLKLSCFDCDAGGTL